MNGINLDSTYSPITRTELESFINTAIEGTDKILIQSSNIVILTINLDIDRRTDGTRLFSVSLDKNNNNSFIQEQVENIFDISGTYDLEIEFLPSNEFKIGSDRASYISKNKIVRKKMESFNA